MTKRFTGRRAVLVAAVAVLGTTAATTIGTGPSPATIYADFADASPLIVGNEVKLGGVRVGQVRSIRVRDGRARVALRLDPAALPVHRDARVTIRPVSLLGERYVALDRGTPTAPALQDGGVIPVANTGRSVDLDQVLDAVDKPTGKALAALLTTVGEGMNGHGKDVDAAVRALAPAMTDADGLVRLLDQQTDLLTSLVDRVTPVAGALSGEQGKVLDRLVGSADQLLATTAANEEALDDTLSRLPGTLADARRTLSRLAGVAQSTTPTLAGLRPTTDNLTQISSELEQLSDAADPALAGLQPVLSRARELLAQAAPVVATLEQAGPDLRATARGARPIATALSGNIRNVLDFVRLWALTTNGHDGLSHYFRGNFVVTAETLTGPIPGGGDLLPSSDLTGLLPQLPSPKVVEDLTDVTGLTSSQEESLLNSLIGGSL
jgi:phospholipid/cholesterol/gamma-HCH transport system substrate-binding protein